MTIELKSEPMQPADMVSGIKNITSYHEFPIALIVNHHSLVA